MARVGQEQVVRVARAALVVSKGVRVEWLIRELHAHACVYLQ